LCLAGAVVGVTVLTCLSVVALRSAPQPRRTPAARVLGLRFEARRIEADWFRDEWTTLKVYAVLDREWATEASGTGVSF
jgi:hypothetical protein